MKDDKRSAYLVEPFCFAPGGTLRLEVRDFHLRKDGREVPAASVAGKVGFIVRHVDGSAYSTANVVDVAGQSCLLTHSPLDKPEESKVVVRAPNASYAMDIQGGKEGLYSVLFANCVPGSSASYALSLTLMNAGNVFVSAGDVPLEHCYAVAACLFFASLAAWVREVRFNAEGVLKIHYLMGVLVLVKALSVALLAIKSHFTMRTGTGGWLVQASYVMAFMKGLLMFSVILLIGSGWSFIKPFLNKRDKRILMVVLPLQVIVNTAMVVVEETPPGTMGWLTWRDILHFFDIVCCCAILFPIVWSISYLKESAIADGKSRRSLAKLKLFREFYILVFCYVYFTRIVVYLVRATMPCAYSYVSKTTSEGATLVFFLVAGYKFRPRQNNPYLKVDEEDEEGTELYEAQEAPPGDPPVP